MKLNILIIYFILLLTLVLINKTTEKGGLKDPKPKSKLPDLNNIDVDKLSEKDLDALLKDPSIASLKINPKAELKKPKSKESKYSADYKEHLKNLSKEGLSVDEPLKLDEPDLGLGGDLKSEAGK